MTDPVATSAEAHSTSSSEARKRDVGLAFVNAMKLGASLLATWGIALVTRLYIPRFLGPEKFGILNFADAFSAAAFVALGLGIETYVRKEVAVRPAHASDFLGGILALRAVLAIFIFGGIEILLRATHRDSDVRLLVYIYGIGQFFMVGSNTSAGLLQATGRVDGVSVLSVVVKVAWAIGTFVAIYFRMALWAFAMTVALAEALRSLVLFWLARKHLKFDLQINPAAVWSVIVASFPFFLSGLATTIYDKIGTNLLAFMTNDREVGWYGAAYGLSGITLMLVPLVSWVLTPLFARAAKDSHDDFFRLLRRSLEFIITFSIPISLMMMLGSDFWVSILFGQAFKPSAMALRVLSIGTALMYVSIVAATALAVLNHTWRMSLVFVGGMIINPVFNVLLIGRMSSIGPGEGGWACAIASLLTEIAIVTPLLIMLGARAFDKRLTMAIVKSIGAALVTIGVDRLLQKDFVIIRLVIDAVCYACIALVSGAVDIRGMIDLIKSSRKKRLGAEASSA